MKARADGRSRTLEERRDDAVEQARLSGIAAAQAEAAKADITAAEAAGEIKAEEAARRFAEADEVAARHSREVERLELLAAKIQEDIERFGYAERLKAYETARGAAEEACAEANKAAELLARWLASAVKAAAGLAVKRDARKAAIVEAQALCDAVGDVDFEYPAGLDEPSILPEAAGLKALLDLVADARKAAAEVSAARRGAEQGKRERAATARKDLIRRYAWTGDEDVLAELGALDMPAPWVTEAVAEAHKGHATVRARALPAVEAILAAAQRGRTSPRGALERLRRSPNIPDDLRAQTARELGVGEPAGAAA